MMDRYDHAELDLPMTDRRCRFCEVHRRERLIHSSAHTAVFPSLGAFVEGWLLVAPREHVVASSELPDGQWHDLDAQVRTANEAVRAEYGPTVLFEHGAAGTNRTAGCGVDHAHLHIVPWVGNLREEIAAVPGLGRFDWQPAGRRPRSAPDEDYIWISDDTGTWITYASELPSQVVRQAMSHALGLDWWDWKVDHRTDTASATLDKLSTVA